MFHQSIFLKQGFHEGFKVFPKNLYHVNQPLTNRRSVKIDFNRNIEILTDKEGKCLFFTKQ